MSNVILLIKDKRYKPITYPSIIANYNKLKKKELLGTLDPITSNLLIQYTKTLVEANDRTKSR